MSRIEHACGEDVAVLNTDDESNKKDVQLHLESTLPQFVQPSDVTQTASLLTERSQGSFLYLRYMHEELKNISQREGNLISFDFVQGRMDLFPSGLSEIYRLQFKRYKEILENIEGKNLYEVTLAPIAVARSRIDWSMFETMILQAGACQDIQLVKITMAAKSLLHETKHGKNKAEIHFGHKTMADWLANVKECGKEFLVSEKLGHEALAKWCVANHKTPFARAHMIYHLDAAGMIDELERHVLSDSWSVQDLAIVPFQFKQSAFQICERILKAHESSDQRGPATFLSTVWMRAKNAFFPSIRPIQLIDTRAQLLEEQVSFFLFSLQIVSNANDIECRANTTRQSRSIASRLL
jgi:hypothetical protein